MGRYKRKSVKLAIKRIELLKNLHAAGNRFLSQPEFDELKDLAKNEWESSPGSKHKPTCPIVPCNCNTTY